MDGRAAKVDDVVVIPLEVFQRNSGKLAAVESKKDLPWQIARAFFITSKSAEERGNHAHIEGSQAFFCTSGLVQLFCRDGEESRTFTLEPLEHGLLVPPGIWTNISLSADSSLAVLTDMAYIATDYLREWNEFMKFKESS